MQKRLSDQSLLHFTNIMKNLKTVHWTRRRSELTGYDFALYCTDSVGDYIRVDFSIPQKKARLTIEDRSETRYYSEISDRHILSEKSTLHKSDKVSVVMKKKSSMFSRIPDIKVLSVIRGCYGIGLVKKGKQPAKKNQSVHWQSVLVLIGILSLVLLAVLCAIFYGKQ
jgi:hypothetical protein